MFSISFLLASVHLLMLPLGIVSVWERSRALRKVKHVHDLAPVLKADNVYGIVTLFWILTGVLRAFAGFEKGSSYYLANTAFLIKMTLFAVVFALEWKPMVTLIRWRIQLRKKNSPDLSSAPLLAQLSLIEIPVLLTMALFASAMARGYLS